MKFALRAMAQSLAREFGPQGVHIAHAVIDGVIDIPRTKGWDLGEGGKIDPDAVSIFAYFSCPCGFRRSGSFWGFVFLEGNTALIWYNAQIADAYWHLHTQPKTAFTWEIDIRPGVEKW